jgi:hypothetical protein
VSRGGGNWKVPSTLTGGEEGGQISVDAEVADAGGEFPCSPGYVRSPISEGESECRLSWIVSGSAPS